ncbi:MAG TPA: GNAT family N-acetyltransferase [Patescibacteria group bacterium]|jgi:N-acetylglutamate synthase-like GNAT family acetyltransferase|nr:GNAT family N-acetyltransferase [Patescibacteria group bacterium]
MNGETLIIRTFTAGDQEVAQQLILNGLAEHFNQLDPSINPDLEEIAATYLKVGDLFLVAELNERIVATGALVRESLGTGRIVRVSVASDKRRMGIGQKIVYHLLEKARELEMRRILVETNLDWSEAIAFYRILGFSEYDRDLERIHMSMQT